MRGRRRPINGRVCGGALPRPCRESGVADRHLGGKGGVQGLCSSRPIAGAPTFRGVRGDWRGGAQPAGAQAVCSVRLTPGARHAAHGRARDDVDQASRAAVPVNQLLCFALCTALL
jgi:hypothetical protein